MPVLIKTLSIVTPVFAIIGCGYVFAGFKKINLAPVVDILLYLTIPALVISSLSRRALNTDMLLTVAFAAFVVVAGTGLLAHIYLRVTGKRHLRGFYLPTMFMNTGNMGFPLALLAFGPDGLTVAVLYYIAISLMVYSIGIYIAKGGGGFKEIFKLPLIYAAALGIALNLSNVTMPTPLSNTFEMLGAATIPLMQLSLGYKLYSTKLSLPAMSLAGSVIRIGGGFIIAYFITWLFGIGGLTGKIIILSSSMPSAVINFIVSHKYKLDGDLVASTVAMSTIISVITVPVVLIWIM
ncbi:MAG: AEC family transporter [Thermodesulfobacteriota bacterium]